ncbi:YecA family protein [Bacillus suaedae]|uniref:SEC-C domain-containing protein n=1 Tax=Halalkalibacter suaedae TaxID=2822140 RepID=A0A940WXN9_9BACI|nr:SEC-C metal-binding domain-containing protein [Bacillus suaedae]MBP3950220.1 SEC-C domain-containing protein [Bacillus suaedae]
MPQMIDKDTEKRLISASQKIEQMHGRREDEQEGQWKELQFPFTLSEGLARLTKDELTVIRRRLEVKKASSLKKAELVALFSEVIPTKVEEIFSVWDQERLGLIRKLIRQGGLVPAAEVEVKAVDSLCLSGLVFSGMNDGQEVLAIPADLIEIIQSLEVSEVLLEKMTRNSEWIRLTHGLLYYYGTLKPDKLIQMLEKYTKSPVDRTVFARVIDEAIQYYGECEINQYGYTHFKVADPERVLHEQQSRIGLEYFPFTKEQLWIAGERDYVDRNHSYRQFVKFLTNEYKMNPADADQLAEECVLVIQNGIGPNEMIDILQHHLEFPTMAAVDDLMKVVVAMINNTKQPFLKGYTSIELSTKMKVKSQPSSSAQKDNVINLATKTMGRNDACLCGSGKKYKKCCGR